MEYTYSEDFLSHMSTPSLIAIVPARGGSKGIPRKNLISLGGKPLIEFTLRAAQSSEVFDDIIVSTDDSEIAEFSRRLGHSIHQRPLHLATDSSRVVDTVLDVAHNWRLDASTLVMVLQPTSPFRGAHHIRQAVDLLRKEDPVAVVSVVECEHHPFKAVRLENQQIFCISNQDYLEASRQDLPRLFRPNGAIYMASLATIERGGTLIPNNAYALEMSLEDSLDIDSQIDLMMAQLLTKLRN